MPADLPRVYNCGSSKGKPAMLLDWFLRNREWLTAAVILATGFGIGLWEFIRWVRGRK